MTMIMMMPIKLIAVKDREYVIKGMTIILRLNYV